MTLRLLCFLWLSSSAAFGQTIFYVTPTGTTAPASATTSWATSTTDLQGAINAAAAGDQVWVAAGTYKPGGGNNLDRTVSFTLKNGVRVLGGFPASGSPTLVERDPRTHVTTLSGDLDNDATLANNSYHLFYLPDGLGLNQTAQLDGFALTGGNAANLTLINTELQAVQGGAVYLVNNSPLFLNCVFRGNRAGGCGMFGCYGYGGAISNDGGSPGFTNCTFTGNSAIGNEGRGGVVYSVNGSPDFTNCSFGGNSAGGAGGVFYESNVPIRFMNCSFQGNSSVDDGFVGVTNSMNWPNNGASITNSVFWNNGGNRAFTYYDAAQAVLSHSLLEAWSDVIFGPGIRYATTSPFTSMTATNLNGCSDAIGTASVASYTALFGSMAASPQSDELGNARFRTGTLDMGARQFAGALTDLLALVSQPPASTVVTVNATVSATFSVTSGGSISYQWYKDNVLLPTQTAATLALPGVQFSDAGRYTAIASISGCSLTSTAFQLSVLPIYSLSLTISANPSLTVTQGAAVTLTASGGTSYTWSSGFVGNPLIIPVNASSIISVSGLTGNDGGIASVSITTTSVACRSTIYVTETGAGIQDGSTWTNAIAGRNLQLAINAAQSCGGQVWVASGTYKPTTGTNRTISFTMRPGVAIYGGFVGSETTLSGRPSLNPNDGQPSSSTLSGDIGTVGVATDNSLHVIFNNPGLTNTAVMDGFVVTGGRADVFGGGMFNNGNGAGQVCSPTVRNGSFIDNQAIYGGAVWNQGGTSGTSSPRFENTYFERNVATGLGGAFYNQPDPNGTASATLINCLFANNSAPDGGAIYNNGYGGGRASPLLLNCAFLNNTATRGAAIFNIGFTNGRAQPTFVNGSFQGNTATGGGGAIFNNPISGTATAMLTSCVLWNNGGAASLTPASTFTVNTSLLDAPTANGSGNLLAGTTPFASTTGVALNNCAPAINTGDVSAYNALSGPSNDLVGNARFRSGALDMGAQQFGGTPGGLATITTQPPASLTINAGDDLSLPVSATGGTTLNYQWYYNGTVLATQTSATLSIPNAQTVDSGTYVVSVSATGGCSTTSTAMLLTVAPSDRPVLTITPLPSAIITAGVAVTLTVSGAISYTWADGTEGNRLIIYPTSTTTISVTGTNALGFTGSRTQTITVVPISCQPILYVTPNGAGTQTGTSWANAIAGRNLQLAINAAQSCGAQVWVASGLYKPTGTPDRTDANRTISFNMQPGVKIYGGFVGSETALIGRPALNPTLGQISSSTLSGEIGDPNSTTDNSYHVLFNGNGITNNEVLDGFVVAGGYAADAGGGMYNNANQVNLSNARWVCSPTVRNVLFTGNFAPLGGAIYNDSRVHGRTNPYLENTVFVSNTATLGGAIMNHTFNYGNANWRAVNCRFERNVATQGGAIYSNGDAGGEANYTVINSVFLGNTATSGGVAYNYARLLGVVSPSFMNCSFAGNSNVNFNDQSVPNGFTPGTTLPTYSNSVFWNNGGGGSFAALGQAPFINNSALEPGTNSFNGTGNVFETSSPFVSATELQLIRCAKAVNLGNSSSYTLVTGPTTGTPDRDAVGNPRYFNNGPIDAGAFELQQAAGAQPVIVSQPVAATSVRAPTPLRIPVSATSTAALSYQWFKNGNILGGQTSATLSIPNTQTTDTGSYSLLITSVDGCTTISEASNVAVAGEFDLTVTALPATTVTFGAPITLVASGTNAYTWNTGATTDRITDFPTATTVYSVTGRSASGVVSTSSITITVLPLPCNPILYVTETGAGTRDGSSWANAVAGQNLQAAMFRKYACGGGQVWVAQGMYKPTTTTNRSMAFQALNTVTLLGGFVGSETALSGRPAVDPRTTEGRPGSPSSSTLSGEIGDPNSTTDNTFHVLYHPIGTNSSAVLDGFVITGGYATDHGGGMLNYATFTPGQPTMNPAISNCLFVNNYAPTGGAVANIDNSSYATVAPTFTNCVFRQNTAINGGAVANLSADAEAGKEGVKTRFTDCVFSQNTAQTDGGAVYNANNVGGITAGNAEPRFVNCLFRDNQAAGMGGAIRLFASLPSNVARSVAGGQWINCGFVGNRAQYGGVLGSSQDRGSTLLSFINSSFQSNMATVSGGVLWAGEFNAGPATLYVINSVFWNNSIGLAGTVPVLASQSGDNTKIQVTTSLLEPGAGNYTATNSLTGTSTPFTSTTDVQLIQCARAIDTGTPERADPTAYTNVIVAGPATDLAGNARFTADRLDMGAMQYQGTVIQFAGITAEPMTGSARSGVPVCQSGSISVPVSVSGTGPFTYQWYKGGGPGVAINLGAAQSTSALSLTNIQPGDAGSYSVVVTGTCNSVTSAAFSLTVNSLPTVSSISTSSVACANGTGSLTATATGGLAPYSFSLNGGPMISALGEFTSLMPGSYTISLSDANGCQPASVSTATIQSPPALTLTLATSSTQTCPGQSVTLTATGMGGVGPRLFDFGGGSSVVSTTVVTPALGSNPYSITLTDANGCSTVQSLTVQGNTNPTPGLAVSGTITCAQRSVMLTANGANGYSFAGPGIPSQNASAGTAVANASGVYSVTVTNTLTGCSSVTSTTVSSNTTAPTVSLAASGTVTCLIPTVSLTATTGIASGSFVFGGSGLLSQNGLAGTAVVGAGGTYSVTVIDPSNGCSSSTTVVVTENTNRPTATLAASGTLTCAQTALTLTATGANQYAFDGPGVVSQNASAGTAVANVSGVYSVTVMDTVTGCSSVTSTTVSSNTTAPPASLVASGSITCANPRVTLTATGGLSYAFTGTGLLASAGNSATVNSAGTFSVVVTGANGCTSVTLTTVGSNTTAPTPGLTSSGTITCANPFATLTATGGSLYTFAGPNVVAQNATAGTATVNLGGLYSVTVTNTTTGCFSTTDVTVASNLTALAPTVAMSSSGSAVCEGSGVTIPAVASGPILGYQWFKDGTTLGAIGQTPALTLSNVQVNQSGSYRLVISSNCGSFTSTAFALTVNPKPTVTLTVPSGSTVVGPGVGVATITVPAPLTGATFQVSGGVQYERFILIDRLNGYEIRQVDTNATGQFPINRTGPFRLTVTGANGCARTVEGTVLVRL